MTSNPLKALHDIQLGKPIGIWPLAYGWYLLIIAISFSLIGLSIWVYRTYQARKPKRQALKELKKLQETFLKKPNVNDMAYQLSVLLKRVCFAYYPREEVASLYGEKWQHFLGNDEWVKSLQRLSYQQHCEDDLNALFPAIKAWIQTCNKRGRNA